MHVHVVLVSIEVRKCRGLVSKGKLVPFEVRKHGSSDVSA